MVDAGHDLVVAEATIRYRAPLRFDDEFDGTARISHLGETSFTVAITLERDGEVCAEGENRYVVVGTDGGGKMPVPDRLREAMQPHLAEEKIGD